MQKEETKLAKKKSLKQALESQPEVLEQLPDAEPAKEQDPQNIAARQVAEFIEIGAEIKELENKAEALKAKFDPVVKPLAKKDVNGNLEWQHKGVRVRYIEVETQEIDPNKFYELVGDNGLRFLSVSTSKVKKAVGSGELSVAKEQLHQISTFGSYERFDAKIVSAAQAAALFELPF